MNKINLLEIQDLVNHFYKNQPLNLFPDSPEKTLFELPLFAAASAKDPLFEALKQESVVSPLHLSPNQWLDNAQTVISYFLPFTKEVREANRQQGDPAMEWLYGRIEGDIFNHALRKYLVEQIQKKDILCVSPGLAPRLKAINKKSNWSERHVAFISGLGTFSLNCSLITKKGAAGRLGSLIINEHIEPTARPYKKIDEYCIYCEACIKRCPPNAISKNGKNHTICSDYLDEIMELYKPRSGCGKCQTAVPCEDKIPKLI